MAIDVGPFRDVQAVEAGIFGRVNLVAVPVQGARDDPGAAPASCSTLGNAAGTPSPNLSGYTTVTMQIFVGENWRESPLNPFSPDLSASPNTIDNLETLTATHVDSGQTFSIVDDIAPSNKVDVCQRDDFGTENSTIGTATGQVYSLTGIARTEYWQFSVVTANIGGPNELWVVGYWYNDVNGWPSVPNRARFHSVASVDDKVTFT